MGPLKTFFKQYSWFIYDPTQSASQQFHRLQTEAGWEREDPEQRDAWEGYLEALVLQFNSSYGENENDLTAWHGLLARIGINNFPDSVKVCKSVSFEFFSMLLGSITRCNQIIRGKFINLVDLVDARDDPSRQVQQFASEMILSEYTLSNHKVFPRDHVAAGSLLRYLLRHILSPNSNRRDPTFRRHNKRKNRR